MLPALPALAPRLTRVAAWSALLAALAAPTVSLALEISMELPREHDGLLVVDARPAQVFSSRVAESLSRGMPATLRLHAEVWRKRRVWFDRLEYAADASVRIRYDVWSDSYLVERIGAAPIVVGSVDSVAAVLERPWTMGVGRVGQLSPQHRYYIVISATLRPLTVEDLAEVEGWLSGEVGARRDDGLGVITEIPRTLFDTVRNVAGFGDQKARVISAEFRLSEVFARE